METIKIYPTGELPVEFEGENIFSEDTQLVKNAERSRYHSIRVFRAEDGSFVCEIGFKTQWQGEQNHCVAKEFSFATEVGDYLQDYDPTQFLVGYPKSDHFKEKQNALIKMLECDWLALKGEAFSALNLSRQLRRGNPGHPLGRCANPGWSIPEKVRDAVKEKAKDAGIAESQFVTDILAKCLEISS